MAQNLIRALWISTGTILLIVPFLPITPKTVSDSGPVWWFHVQSWLIGTATVVVLAAVAGRYGRTIPRRPLWPFLFSPAIVVNGCAVLMLGAALYAMHDVFAGNPHLVDEVAQLFHARIFASGNLAAPVPANPEFFLFLNTLITPDGWVSQYPPGHPALLAAGMLVGAEWLVNPVLAALSVYLVYLLGRRLYGPKTGMISAFLWTISGWVIFMSGTYQSHVAALTFALVAWIAVIGIKRPGPQHALLCGLALGLLGAIRPLDAVAAGIPIFAWLFPRRQWRSIPWMVVGTIPFVIVVAVFNAELYGNPLTLGYTALYGEAHGLGFHRNPWGQAFTPLDAVANTFHAVRRINIYLFDWPIPAALPLGVWALWGRQRSRDTVLGAGLLALFVCYFFYWYSAFYIGPRFYYGMTPFLAIGTARAWKWASRRARLIKRTGFRLDVAVAAMAVVTIVWGLVGLFPARAETYRFQFQTAKLDPADALRSRGVEQALVLVPDSWLSRTLSGLWVEGAPASLVEHAASRLDGCDLHNLLGRARREEMTPVELTTFLEAMLAEQTTPVPRLPDAPDPALRLRDVSGLDPGCAIELEREYRGFSLYGQFAWLNAVGLDSGIVFARDLFERNGLLFAQYPGWEVWRFAPPSDDPMGLPQLTPVGTIQGNAM